MIATKTSIGDSRLFYRLVHWRTTLWTFHGLAKTTRYLEDTKEGIKIIS